MGQVLGRCRARAETGAQQIPALGAPERRTHRQPAGARRSGPAAEAQQLRCERDVNAGVNRQGTPTNRVRQTPVANDRFVAPPRQSTCAQELEEPAVPTKWEGGLFEAH